MKPRISAWTDAVPAALAVSFLILVFTSATGASVTELIAHEV